VLLFTDDGGLKWHRLLNNAVPGLNLIRFGDPKTGYALGDGSEQYPTGVFKTSDSGRRWEPVKGPRSPSWLAADFKDGKTGALTGAWSRLATLNDDVFGTAKVDNLGVRSLRGLQLRDGRGLAVGQGGLILTSASGGTRWGFAELKVPTEVLAAWDFHGLHSVGEHIWVVGRPGSVVLHSANRGAGWEICKTGQPLPLNGVYFFDEKRGWAVGEMGTVLMTGDGGRTWTVKRRGGQRAGVLFAHARPQDLPVDTLAVLGLEEGWLATCVRVTAPDPRSEAPARASDPQRFAGAARLAGGAAGEQLWQFPVPQHLRHADKNDLLKFWTGLHGVAAEKQMVRQMVLALRVWRPDVVVTDHPDPRVTGNAAGALVAEALHEAFAQAADPKAFPEQIEYLGLQPWRVSKVYALWDKADGSHVSVGATDELSRLESSARDFAAPAAGLLVDAAPVLPAQRYYRLLDTNLEKGAAQRHLMDGVPRTEAGVACRALRPTVEPTEAARKAASARRQFRTLVNGPVAGLADSDKLLGLLKPALAGLPEDQGAAAIYGMASAYARRGEWPSARELFLLMVERYPTHARTVEACRWLVRHGSSSEARRRHELSQFMMRGTVGVVGPRGPAKGENIKPVDFRQFPGGAAAQEVSGQGMPKADDFPHLVPQQRFANMKDPELARKWYTSSLELGNRLAAFGPLFASDPPTQFCLQAARRQLGQFKEAQEYYAWFKTAHADGPWREVAASELWLMERQGQPPRPVAACRRATTRPHLDGNLDDECWKGAQPLTFRNSAEETLKENPTQAWFAYDREFLYLALRCKHPTGRQVAPVKARPRDADLRAFDRVSILLDLDRDYSTCFQLQVDQRGCVCEDCWGDKSWDPKWFVAVRSEADCWQIEAAIPLRELTSDPVASGTVWACNVVRVLPGRGVQAWSLPAAVEPRPEGMGLLFFQGEQASPRPMPPAR